MMTFYSNVSACIFGYDYYNTLTIQSSQVSGSSNLTNFPILVQHTDINLKSVGNGGKVQHVKGWDISFSNAAGTALLDHEIESYDPITGSITFWVRIPLLSPSANTEIRILYGKTGITVNPSLETVWDTNFKGIWHLKDTLADATSNNTDLINYNDLVTSVPTAKASSGANFNAGDYLFGSTGSQVVIPGDLTISAWINLDAIQSGANDNVIVSCAGSGSLLGLADYSPYQISIDSDWKIRISWNYTFIALPATDAYKSTVSASPFLGSWSYISVTRNSASQKLIFYQNGVQIGTPVSYSSTPNGGSNTFLVLGTDAQDVNDDLDGKLDEVRISNTVRSDDWELTSFNSINNPSTFYTLGTEEDSDADFAYSQLTFCPTDPNPTPIINGINGGVFSSTSGLNINSTTGEINISASAKGSYSVTYTSQSGCITSQTIEIDNTPPVMICKNINLYLDISGNAMISASDIDNGSVDNCSSVLFLISKNSFNCSNIGANIVTLTGTDASGNSTSCSSTVTIIDTIRPVPNTTNLPNLTAECTLTTYTVPNSLDNCGSITATTTDPLTYSTQGTHTINWTYEDASGNITIQTQSVIIDDVTNPTIVCGGDITENPNAACQFTLLDYTSNTNTLTDNCGGTPTVTQSPAIGTVITGTTTVMLTANDGNGNTATCSFDVLLADNTPPTMACQNINVYLDGAGDASILPADLDNGSTDNCGTVTFTASKTSFDCSDLGANSVTLTGTDAASNAANCTSTVTVIDTINPVPNVTSLPTLTAECTLTAVAPTATDNCGTITATTLDPVTFNSQGTYSITWVYTDASSNVITQTQSVIIDDVTKPTIVCGGDITENPNAACQFTLLDYTSNTNTLTDNCGGTPTVTQSPTIGTVITGTTTVTLTANDGNGNTAACSFDVLLADITPPTMACQNINVYLDGAGDATINPTDLDNGSTDNCGTVTLTASKTSFDCSNLGANTLTLTGTDANSNAATCTSIVTVIDTINPVPNVATLPALTAECTLTVVAPTATDNCGGTITATTTNPLVYNSQGTYSITWVYTDASSNVVTQTQSVIIDDVTNPTIVCGGDITENPNAACQFTLLDYTSNTTTLTDNCGGTPAVTQSPAIGTVITGTTTVMLTANDGNGNTATCSFDVLLADNTPPTMACQNINVYLDGAGDATINPTDLDNGSTDNCGTVTFTASKTSFDCSDLGANSVTLTGTDATSNAANCTSTVTVIDTINPVPNVTSLPTLTAECTLTTVAPTATDNCGTITATTLDPVTFNSQGTYSITWVYTDASSNVITQTQSVIIDDVTNPTIICGGDITENPNAACQFTLLDYTSNTTTLTDNCGGTPTVTQSPAIGTVITGTTTVMLTANDGNGNTATCSFDVLLADITPPTMACQNINVYLDGAGDATINPTDLDNGSTDNCGTVTFTASKTSFDCSDLGANSVTLTVTDVSSNAANCTSTVTVIDTINPVPNVTSLPTLTAECTLTAVAPTATDNCGGTITATTTNPLVYNTQGTYSITWVYTDASSNVITQTQSVIIDDVTNPTIICGGDITENPNAACQFTLLDYTSNTTTLTDNCGGTPTVTQSPAIGTVITGTTTVTLTANDGNGNTAACSFDVLLADITPPTMACQNINIYLDGAGDATINPTDLDNGSTDNCGTVIFTASKTSFDCSDLGANSVTLTVTDVSNNSANCTSTVTVIDTINPVPNVTSLPILTAECTLTAVAPTATDNCGGTITATTTNPLVYNTQGAYMITWTYTDASSNAITQTQSVIIDDVTNPTIICGGDITENPNAACQFTLLDYTSNTNTLTDNCGGTPTVTQSPAIGTVITGTTTVMLTANDGNGNTATCSFDVLLADITPPTMACQNINVYIDGAGDASILPADLDNGSTDNCGTVTFTASKTSFDCSDLGANTITLTGTDAIGNSANCTSTVTVIDTIKPTISCTNNIVSCDSVFVFGQASSDNCATVTVNQISGQTSGTIFPIGITVNTFEAIDGSGNRDTCFFTIERLPLANPFWSGLPAETCSNSSTINLSTLVTGTAGGDFSGPGVNINIFDPTQAGPGTHTISYHVENIACFGDSALQITVTDVSTITAGVDNSVCQLTHQLDASSNLDGFWTSVSGNVSFSNNLDTITYLSVSQYGIESLVWNVSSPTVCVFTDTVNIEFQEEPTAYAGMDTIVYQNLETTLNAVLSTGNGYWEILNGNAFISEENNPNSEISSTEAGTNEIIWTEQNGICPITQDTVIVTFKHLVVPEGLSPNQDGYNDYFKIEGINQFDQIQLVVIDRWGKLVYENMNYQNEWQGQHLNGETLNDDTYFYEVIIDQEKFKGFVVIKK